jgi:predicted  nucleic acid-binding Zn-ribbon protein
MAGNDQAAGLHLGSAYDTWEEEEAAHRHKLKVRALWGTLAVLGLALLYAAWHTYPILQQQSLLPARLASLPFQLSSVTDTLAAASKRADATDAKVNQLASVWDATRGQFAALEGRVSATLQAAGKETRTLVNQMQRRIEVALEKRLQVLQARLSRVEAGQESAQARVAKLEEELAAARQENVRQLALLEQDRERTLHRVDEQLASLDQQVKGDNRELAAVRTQIERRRVEFEAGTNHTRDLAPGVTLQVSHTNVNQQRFDGWVFLMPDRRTVWVHGQGLQQPLVFYSQGDGRPRELVITRVTKYSVIGYVLLPESRA